jgi:hypothetical protein
MIFSFAIKPDIISERAALYALADGSSPANRFPWQTSSDKYY